MTDELVPTAQRAPAPAPALPPGLGPAAERLARTTFADHRRRRVA
jgi:hypothetical protein